MHILISLIWLRNKASGGVESYTRNILDGLKGHADSNKYTLLCSSDNYTSFFHYSEDVRFDVIDSGVETRNLVKSIYYETFKLDKVIKKMNADICFVPSYRMPLFGSKQKYIIVIHDLIAYHLPENFKWFRRNWLQFGWKQSCKRANRIIAITDYVKRDILEKFDIPENKIDVIHNPILPNVGFENFENIAVQYGIKPFGYFYCVSSLMKHKNLISLLKALVEYRQRHGIENTPKLIISGVGINVPEAKTHFVTSNVFSFIEENNLKELCIFTGYVSDERRNSLIKKARLFLFPSVYEGFGMPPVEALQIGTPVLTTYCTALPEATENKANYVENPYSAKEWADKMEREYQRTAVDFPNYSIGVVISRYLYSFSKI